jgi:beta-phosphoglucomutase
MDAVIFDFDGVIIDSEPIHYDCFRLTMADQGIALDEEIYNEKYLGYSDRDALQAMAEDYGKSYSQHDIDELIRQKTQLVLARLGESVEPMAGAVELVRALADQSVPLAICSGALREEIVLPCRTLQIDKHIRVIVAAEDVQCGKPDPQGYLLAAEQLAETVHQPISPRRCVVIEDSPWGIQAGEAAGMAVLGVASSYPAEDLSAARVVNSLAEVTPEDLAMLIDAVDPC